MWWSKTHKKVRKEDSIRNIKYNDVKTNDVMKLDFSVYLVEDKECACALEKMLEKEKRDEGYELRKFHNSKEQNMECSKSERGE